MPETKSALILSPDQQSRDKILASVQKFHLSTQYCSRYQEARSLLLSHRFDIVLCSDTLADGRYADVITAAKPVPVVVFSHLPDWGPYVAALDAGAYDYVACPPDIGEMDRIVTSALNKAPQPAVKAACAH